MFQKVEQARFLEGEHEVLRFWEEQEVFRKLLEQNRGKPKWSFLDGPITANNPMGVHHAWGRTYKDAYQRYFAMTGHELRYQNGFDCQGLWVEVEVEKELNLGTKTGIEEYGIDRFVHECKRRVLKFAARQTEQSVRLGYWMEWDDPAELRKLAEGIGEGSGEDSGFRIQDSGSGNQQTENRKLKTENSPPTTYRTARGQTVTGPAEQIIAQLGNPEWGGSYFTFSTENNETIWTFLKKCFERGKVYRGHDVMPWSGRGGSAYSQMEVADGRKLTTHKSCFVRFPILREDSGFRSQEPGEAEAAQPTALPPTHDPRPTDSNEYLLVWTTTPWTLTANVAAAVNPDLEYVKIRAKRDGAIYYFAKENLNYKRLEKEFKEGFGRPEWQWPEGVPKLKTIAQIFKEQGGFEELGTIKGEEMIGWRYAGPFDDLRAQQTRGGWPAPAPDVRSGSTSSSRSGPMAVSISRSGSGPWRGVESHRVIDGGRDAKGSPNVVAGEGTGIVHIAPGCGDIDHKIGVELVLPIIAPLRADGTYDDGFGLFTGKEAIDPATAELVFEELRRKDLLVYVETYPHIYPHCWRTGDELVFRLVDEWFINMDWREEIKEVVKTIRWIPDSIQGQERELEWLETMRDWMISKKRFWGLALPVWVDPDNPTDFEVIGSLEELKARATDGGEGWEEFEGHTPHRPWIDKVKIKSKKTGRLLSRIEDVGNPWLDAGIVPFSTLNYNAWKRGQGSEVRGQEDSGARIQDSGETEDQQPTANSQQPTAPFLPTPHSPLPTPLHWPEWFPADFVTECFPGQFRNWFYSLLALATMMRYDETDKPEEKRPFKNLLGHRLVMDEHGNPMHKSDGTAIWFEEAAEQLGVDTLRWMYLAQNPASDLRFGTRHPDEPVTLKTPEGPISETKEGLPTCRVTSKPADEIRRQILIPLWNSYAFFVNYAVLDEFDPTLEQVPLDQRPEIDRWILSRLQELTGTAHESFEAFNVAEFMRAAETYIDDLSNWYIRRNRRRFWRKKESGARSQDSGTAAWDADKLAAYQTLYEVLVTLCKLLAPAIPFLTERMYRNLCQGSGARGQGAEGRGPRAKGDDPDADPSALSTLHSATSSPLSVHLCPYPEVDEIKLDAELNWKTQQVQTLVRLGHRLRETAELRVRQPLAELRFACADRRQAEVLEEYREIIADELNVKQIVRAENLDELVSYVYKPNLKTLGPKYGKLLKVIRQGLSQIDPEQLKPLRNEESVTVEMGGEEITFDPADLMVSVEQASDWASADEGGIQVALSTQLSEGLVQEGMARDMVRHIQQLRKEADLEENQRIRVWWSAVEPETADGVTAALDAWSEMIRSETRADAIEPATSPGQGKRVSVGEIGIELSIQA